MKRDNLTAKYRPQTFAQVAGQEYIKKILSRACAEDRIASSYIFSGTRGVGKTTLARILAKGMNCLKGPGPEPCNECANCEQITSGTSMDVMEIDGASYTGVDNVRRLREDVFHSPLGCRYKVVIIDEVHMLSKAAFNALLKTIEEPPGHCVFIMATTEPQKIPATIISRCQHFVFKNLTRLELEKHLCGLLDHENIQYESEAVRILAKRGEGSVRDSMSLLGQVLALGNDSLQEKDVRQVLGLAGQEFFLALIDAIHDQDLEDIEQKISVLLDQGLDLAYFICELAQCWRNMFLIVQAGDKFSSILDIDQEFRAEWKKQAARFSPQYTHAAWQMVLESQYAILKSLEPGQALELLLINLAFLPHLLPSADVGSGDKDIQDALQGMDNSKKKTAFINEPRQNAQDAYSCQPEKERDKEDEKNFEGFVEFCAQQCQPGEVGFNALKTASVSWPRENKLMLSCRHRSQGESLRQNGKLEKLKSLAREYFGEDCELQIELPEKKAISSHKELKDKVRENPAVNKIIEKFDARIIDVQMRRNEHSQI